jgi:hypothetical protein
MTSGAIGPEVLWTRHRLSDEARRLVADARRLRACARALRTRRPRWIRGGSDNLAVIAGRVTDVRSNSIVLGRNMQIFLPARLIAKVALGASVVVYALRVDGELIAESITTSSKLV